MDSTRTIPSLFKALRGVRWILCFAGLVSAVGMAANIWLSALHQADSDRVNNMGRMRYLTYQVAVDFMTARCKPGCGSCAGNLTDVHVVKHGALTELERITSALLGRHDEDDVPSIKDSRLAGRLEEWSSTYLPTLHSIVAAEQPGSDDDVAIILSNVRKAVGSMDELVDHASANARERADQLLALSLSRSGLAVACAFLSMRLFAKVWSPYVALYEREMEAQQVIHRQSMTIEEQRGDIKEQRLEIQDKTLELNEHGIGQVKELSAPATPVLARSSGSRRSKSSSERSNAKKQRRPAVQLGTNGKLWDFFEETPHATAAMILGQAAWHINPCGEGCCSWHVVLAAAHQAISRIAEKHECRVIDTADMWQCGICLAVNTKDEDDDSDKDGVGEDLHKYKCMACLHETDPLWPAAVSSAVSFPTESTN